MRHIWTLPVLAACSLVFLTGCPSRATVKPVIETKPEQKVVERFLRRMIDDDEEGMKKLISPQWIEENDIDLNDYRVNAYSPQDFEITKVKGTKVTAEIIFGDGDAHRLEFRVRKENGKYYIVPGLYDEDNWIHPWTDVETNVR
ncbi:MAG: hypothetical protein ABIL25_08045 [candidate division WOR-3 bacterium]